MILAISDLKLDPLAPLLVVDVDEVLALFMRGFGRYVATRGFELRLDRFALFQNIYRPSGSQHIDLAEGRRLFDEFFSLERHDIEATPGAQAALETLAKRASIVILTNAPESSREARARWLVENGLPYPLLLGSGPKGAPVAALAAETRGPTIFVDDLLSNLESVAEVAPQVHRFQLVADTRLRSLAPTAPDRHTRIDDWPALAAAISARFDL
jgi:hypothetical protein